MDTPAAAHDAAVQMIDTSIARVHQHAACIARNKRQSMGRSPERYMRWLIVAACRFGSRSKTVAAHDNRLAAKLLSCLKSGSMPWLMPTGLERSASMEPGRISLQKV